MISAAKMWKILKSENDVKKLLGAFNQELWAISGFLKSGQKSSPYLTRSLRGPANDLHARSRGDRIVWMSWKVKKKPQKASKSFQSRLMSNLIIFMIRIMCRKTIQLGLTCNWVSQAEKITKKKLDVTHILPSPFGVQRLSIYTTRR